MFNNTTAYLHNHCLTSDALDAPLLSAGTHRIDCSISGDPADGGGAEGGGRGRGRHEEELSLPDGFLGRLIVPGLFFGC